MNKRMAEKFRVRASVRALERVRVAADCLVQAGVLADSEEATIRIEVIQRELAALDMTLCRAARI